MPHRQDILTKLKNYTAHEPREIASLQSALLFIEKNPTCFERSHVAGHVTGSAWILNPARTKALLVHHKKLDMWIQAGGHADGDADILHVARKEVNEETGIPLEYLKTLNDGAIFDVDCHIFPAKKEEQAHIYYDIRFLFEADESLKIFVNKESHDVRWFTFDEILRLTPEGNSVRRMVQKSQNMHQKAA